MSTISAALKDAKQVEYLVQVEAAGYIGRFAMRSISVPNTGGDPVKFSRSMLEPPIIGSVFSISTMESSEPEVTIKLANNIRLQDIEASTELDGSIVTIYAWCEGLQWSDISNAGILYRGLFRKIYHDLLRYEFSVVSSLSRLSKTIPEATINTISWPLHRTSGNMGSVAGKPQPIVMGDWGIKLPILCVDDTSDKYLLGVGPAKSVDADYGSTKYVYDKAGAEYGAANYVFYPSGLDGEGNIVAYFDLSANPEASYEPLICSVSGLMDGSGEITGTAGSLIQHPAEIAYYLLLSGTRIGKAHINAGSFARLRSILGTMKGATYINAQASGVDVVRRILGQCSASLIHLAGQEGVMVLGPDISAGGKQLDYSRVRRTTRISKTDDEAIVNNLTVLYAVNPGTGGWDGVLTYNRANHAGCNQSFSRYGDRPVTIEYPDIQDEESVRALALRHLSIHAQRHDVIETTVPVFSGFDILEGDAALLTLPEGSSVDGAGWVDEKCILLSRQFSGNVIKQTWWRCAI